MWKALRRLLALVLPIAADKIAEAANKPGLERREQKRPPLRTKAEWQRNHLDRKRRRD